MHRLMERLAINKPPALTSADVLREAQREFNRSDLFRPWLENEEARLAHEHRHLSRRPRSSRWPLEVKLGHGGTLDPMATGVLIVGAGSGTKSLQSFLSCTKTYETVVLFGKATDTYDTEGKVVARKQFDHITRDMVENALEQFRGDIMQIPPIFSALRMDGKRLYEYAREGIPLPREIKKRPVQALQLELMDFMEGGSHAYHWPEMEAEREVKRSIDEIFHLDGDETPPSSPTAETAAIPDTGTTPKRKHEEASGNDEPRGSPTTKRIQLGNNVEHPDVSADDQHSSDAAQQPTVASTEREPCPAPACRLRMTVSSGFYVRSLCHDLGPAVDSLATMASLVRTRQAEFELGKNVLEFDDLKQGEDIWAPKIKQAMAEWAAAHPTPTRSNQHSSACDNGGSRSNGAGERQRRPSPAKRRNSSSDEDET